MSRSRTRPSVFGMALMWVAGVLLTCVPVCFAQEKVIVPDLSRIIDGKTWIVINADCDTATEDGKRVVHLKPKGKAKTPSDIGLALVEGLEFAEGTVEIELKGKGTSEASFLGVAFNVVDGKDFEAVYFRPFNFMREPESFRARAVQYVAWPEHTWESLRKGKPGMYESAVKPIPDPSGWFHARIEVTKRKVSVWVDDAKEPCLVVDRLASREKGKVGLWVDSREGAFSNLKIRLGEARGLAGQASCRVCHCQSEGTSGAMDCRQWRGGQGGGARHGRRRSDR